MIELLRSEKKRDTNYAEEEDWRDPQPAPLTGNHFSEPMQSLLLMF